MSDPSSARSPSLLPADLATTKIRFESCSSKEKLLAQSEFGDHRTPKNDEYIEMIFKHVLDNTIEYLHNVKNQTVFVSAYMIAITYINRMVHGERDEDILLTDTGLGCLTLSPAINEHVAKWKTQRVVAAAGEVGHSLVGVIFIADENTKNSLYADKLQREGAVCIAVENTLLTGAKVQKSSAYFVANKFVVFAINEGIETLLKSRAQHYRVYTASFLRENSSSTHVTLTTRFFEDLQSVGRALGKTTSILATCDRKNNDKTPVVISLGYKGFDMDVLLFKLGQKLQHEGHPIVYYFFDHVIEYTNVRMIVANKKKWAEAVGEGVSVNQKFNLNKLEKIWSFCVHCIARAEININDLFKNGDTIDMTVPLPKCPGISFQITRHPKSPQTIFDFVGKIVREYLPSFETPQPQN